MEVCVAKKKKKTRLSSGSIPESTEKPLQDADDYIANLISKSEHEVKPVKKAKAGKPKPEFVRSKDKLVRIVEHRKLSQKSESALRDRWSAENSAASRNSLMDSMRAVAREKFGVSRVFGSREELEQLAAGIPLPSLALEHLLGNDVFLLSAVVMIAGSWGSCKTSLLFEVMRWVYDLSGLGFHIDTEDKFDADFCCDIMRVPHDVVPIISNRASNLELMQQMLTHYIKEAKKILEGTKEAPGPGRTLPCVFGIDSLAAATSEEIQEKILKEGNANRAHPINALKNTFYLNGIKSALEGWPFTLVVVNHLKEKLDDMGNTHQYTLGGQTFNFHESVELRCRAGRKLHNTQWTGNQIGLQCAKNSFGPTGRRITTRFIWGVEDDPETNKPHDWFRWDWDWALIHLLDNIEGTDKKRLRSRDISITTKSPTADLECLANVPALGMGKNDFLPWPEVGAMIQQNEDVCERIRDALNIKIRPKLGKGYDELMRDHRKKVK
jgi:RecA/RadA recombinase